MSRVVLVCKKGRYNNIVEALNLAKGDFAAEFRVAEKPLIKVNFVSDSNQLAATHVDGVRAVLDFLSPLTSQKILVVEASYGSTKRAFSNFGYFNLEREYENVELRDLNGDKTEEREGLRLSKTILDSDFRISVGPPKTHDTTILTAAMKNMVVGSIITGGLLGTHWRGGFHRGSYREVNERLVKLFKHVQPQLAVIDGYEAMEGRGPGGGDPVRTDWALAGTNAVEVDAVCAYLLGFDPRDLGYLYFAQKFGLGEINLSKIEVVGDAPEAHCRKIRPHPNFQDELRWKVEIPPRRNPSG